MQQNQFVTAIEMLAEEKGLSKDIIMETVELALAAAYKKDYGDKDQEVRVVLKGDSVEPQVFVSREVVEDGDVENDFLQIGLTDAKKIDKKAAIGTEEEPYMVKKSTPKVSVVLLPRLPSRLLSSDCARLSANSFTQSLAIRLIPF
jgi:hypothetical protein